MPILVDAHALNKFGDADALWSKVRLHLLIAAGTALALDSAQEKNITRLKLMV